MRNIFDFKDNLHEKDDIPAVLKWGKVSKEKPEVSILMPVYNHPHFFKMALETAINQDYQGSYEIVILDNNQDDNVDHVNDFEQYVIEKNCPKILYYKNNQNIEGINSYNRLPQLANAEYFTFLHDDDELCPNCLSELIDIKYKKGLKKELIVSSTYYIDKDSKPFSKATRFNGRNLWGRNYKMSMYDWFQMSYTNGGGVLHHRESFLELGGYCSEYIPSADYAFYILYVSKFGGYYLNKYLFRYRWAENDSMKVYEQCTKRDRQFRMDMISLINLPDFALKKCIKAQYNVRLEENDLCFKNMTNRPASRFDHLIVNLMVIYKMLTHIF